MKYENIILALLVVVIVIAPMIMYSGLGEDQGYFGGSDDQGSDGVSEAPAAYGHPDIPADQRAAGRGRHLFRRGCRRTSGRV